MKKFLPILLICFLFLNGCLIRISPRKTEAGIFKSNDGAKNWQQAAFAGKGDKEDLTIGNASIVEFKFDPKDSNKIYLGTQSNGGFVSENSGTEWKSFGPPTGAVNHISINPLDTKEVYIAQGNNVFKTVDGGENWLSIYTETRGTLITDLEVDAYNPKRIYISFADGQLLRTENAGQSWAPIHNIRKSIVRMYVNPRDTRQVYLFTLADGFHRTRDAGATWQHIKEEIQAVSGDGLFFHNIARDPSKNNAFYLISRYGVMYTTNGGDSFSDIPLLTPPNSIAIFDLAVNPKNSREFYYTTLTKLYVTKDGGKTWNVQELPSPLFARFLEIDPKNSESFYLGMHKETPVIEVRNNFFSL